MTPLLLYGLLALSAVFPQEGAPPTGDEEILSLKDALRALDREEDRKMRLQALRSLAQFVLEEDARQASEARKGLRKALDDRDVPVAKEAVRLVLVTEEPAEAERELASRLKESVRFLRRFLAEVEHRKKTRNAAFVGAYPEFEGNGRLAMYPELVEAYARGLKEVPGDRARDALEDLLGQPREAQSSDLVLGGVEALLEQELPAGAEVVVDWLNEHRKELTARTPPEDGRARKLRQRELQEERFGRLKRLRSFSERYPAVDERTYLEVLERLDAWTKERQLPAPPLEGEAKDWKAWLRELRSAARGD